MVHWSRVSIVRLGAWRFHTNNCGTELLVLDLMVHLLDMIAPMIMGRGLWLVSLSELDTLELQEAISKGKFQHDVSNLEPATTYSLYLKAYSPLGASQQSHTVVATTLGGGTANRPSSEADYLNLLTGVLQEPDLVPHLLDFFFQGPCLFFSPNSSSSSNLLHQGGELQQCAGAVGAAQ